MAGQVEEGEVANFGFCRCQNSDGSEGKGGKDGGGEGGWCCQKKWGGKLDVSNYDDSNYY